MRCASQSFTYHVPPSRTPVRAASVSFMRACVLRPRLCVHFTSLLRERQRMKRPQTEVFVRFLELPHQEMLHKSTCAASSLVTCADAHHVTRDSASCVSRRARVPPDRLLAARKVLLLGGLRHRVRVRGGAVPDGGSEPGRRLLEHVRASGRAAAAAGPALREYRVCACVRGRSCVCVRASGRAAAAAGPALREYRVCVRARACVRACVCVCAWAFVCACMRPTAVPSPALRKYRRVCVRVRVCVYEAVGLRHEEGVCASVPVCEHNNSGACCITRQKI